MHQFCHTSPSTTSLGGHTLHPIEDLTSIPAPHCCSFLYRLFIVIIRVLQIINLFVSWEIMKKNCIRYQGKFRKILISNPVHLISSHDYTSLVAQKRWGSLARLELCILHPHWQMLRIRCVSMLSYVKTNILHWCSVNLHYTFATFVPESFFLLWTSLCGLWCLKLFLLSARTASETMNTKG